MQKNKGPLISVIVPAYNAEKTIRKCLDTILMWEDDSLEVIVSNDGSTDSTWEIIKEYTSKDRRVIGITSPNGGTCCAKNRGMNAAAGQWITFADADDFVAPMIFRSIAGILTAYQPDILDFQYSILTNNATHPVCLTQLPKDSLRGQDWIQNVIVPVLLNISDKKEFLIGNFVWNKVYKASIIREHGVMFDETRRKWEDRLFSLTFLQYARTYYSMSEYGYYYVCGNTQTLSMKFDPDSLKIIVDSYCKYLEMYGEKYCFDTAYTTNYFCNLLIDTAKDQFAYPLTPAHLKSMFSIFVDNETVQSLFSGYTATEKEKMKICTAIRSRDTENVYAAFELYVSRAQKQVRKMQCKYRVRHLLSRLTRVFVHN